MKTPTNLFTVQINNLMRDDARKCAHARRALALYASGDVVASAIASHIADNPDGRTGF